MLNALLNGASLMISLSVLVASINFISVKNIKKPYDIIGMVL